jgi:predicted nucleotidyltransferase
MEFPVPRKFIMLHVAIERRIAVELGYDQEAGHSSIRATIPLRVAGHPLAAIRRFARHIAERFHPDRIILFGSYACGKPHEESDVDVLVVMRTKNVIDQSVRITLAFEQPFALDVIVRTPWQIERGMKDNNWFLREIMEKGKVLYEARDGKMGLQQIPRRNAAPSNAPC